MDKDKKSNIIQASKEFRKGYLKDIETFGESYWKEMLLNKFGSLSSSGMTWDYWYDSEFAKTFDTCTVLEVAEVLIKEF